MDKSVLKSKTLWVSLIVAIAPLFPVVQDIVSKNPEAVAGIVGAVFAILRITTTQPVTFTNSDK